MSQEHAEKVRALARVATQPGLPPEILEEVDRAAKALPSNTITEDFSLVTLQHLLEIEAEKRLGQPLTKKLLTPGKLRATLDALLKRKP